MAEPEPGVETTSRIFTYDDNNLMTHCEERQGQFDKTTYTDDELGNRTLTKKTKLYSYLESWQNTTLKTMTIRWWQRPSVRGI